MLHQNNCGYLKCTLHSYKPDIKKLRLKFAFKFRDFTIFRPSFYYHSTDLVNGPFEIEKLLADSVSQFLADLNRSDLSDFYWIVDRFILPRKVVDDFNDDLPANIAVHKDLKRLYDGLKSGYDVDIRIHYPKKNKFIKNQHAIRIAFSKWIENSKYYADYEKTDPQLRKLYMQSRFPGYDHQYMIFISERIIDFLKSEHPSLSEEETFIFTGGLMHCKGWEIIDMDKTVLNNPEGILRYDLISNMKSLLARPKY